MCADCAVNPPVNSRLCHGCYGFHQRAGSLDYWRRLASLPAGPPALDLSWHLDALCAETDPEIFFPAKGESVKEAKAVCRGCLVRAECLEYALETRQRFGVWAGLSERDRRKLLGEPEDDAEEASAA